MMFLSHISAIELQEARPRALPAPSVTGSATMQRLFSGHVPTFSNKELAAIERQGVSTDELHVLVSSRDDRRGGNAVRCHAWSGPLPPGSFRRVGDGLFVCAPELAFVQMATSLSLVRLIKLGYELCGTFTPDDAVESGVRERAPLASAASLAAFAEKAVGMPGKAAAARAARYVLDGSASPKESELAMRLFLPCSLGGYGLPAPSLNHKVTLDKAARRIYPHAYCRCDVCYPEAHLDIEYDGICSHTGAARIQSDARRRNALMRMGYGVIVVTQDQLANNAQMDQIARMVAKGLGWRFRRRDYEWGPRRAALCRELAVRRQH
jgi:hypothetical protein